jgi:DNA (cytosine-5)-methyltransferase 1
MKKIINVGSDFSGVGAFNQALKRLKINYNEVFACDWNKYSRQTFVLNYGEPKYFPMDVYKREIPKESLDIFMTSPPCQAFSLAGKRKGEGDDRGVLFYNSHEFITKNKPRYFIFENVKGLLSDDGGKTFARWLGLLGGKSVNGNPIIFPHEESTPYHVYHQVLNAKNYGVPQNRERIFIIGIRDDCDNNFTFPKPFHLEKRLKDVLESEVDEKYFLSDKMVGYLQTRKDNFNNGKINYKDENDVATTITKSSGSIDISDNIIKVGFINQDTQASQVISENGIMPNVCAGTHGYALGYVETKICAIRGRNPKNPLSRVSGLPTEQMLEINENGTSNALTTVQKDNVVVEFNFDKNLPNTYNIINFDGNIKSLGNEKRNTVEILLALREEIGKKTVEAWGLRIMEVICEEDLLQSGLYENRSYQKREKTRIRNNNKNKQKKSAGFIANVIMRSLPKDQWSGCSSQRRKSIKQLIRKLNESVQKLSYDNTSTKNLMQIRKMSNVFEEIGLLRETLPKIQEIWESINGKAQSVLQHSRIRRLTPLEAFRLMDFPETFKWDVSDSQAYKQAGNSIVVNCLVELISKLNL